jgi:hypothetical protein
MNNIQQVILDGEKYNILGKMRAQRLRRFPARIQIGDNSYKNQTVLSDWIKGNNTGGLGVGEMDESTHADRYWWSNCNTDYPNHLTLGRLATKLTLSGDDGVKCFANFNGKLYVAADNTLYVLASDRASFTVVKADFPANITALIPSLNSRLYILLGDSDEYWYMATDETCTESDEAGTYGIQWDNKLFKFKTDGTGAYSTDPDGADPTWTAIASITDIASQIEKFIIGKDADGNDVIYCATNSVIKTLNFADDIWYDTSLRLPNHPNGGRGATYWRDGHYFSVGLDVIRYITGSTATISDVGLNRDDGLPFEYNGEITALNGDGVNDMFAAVDSSQVSGNSYSGLYAYNGSAWRCWWIDTTANQAMNDIIVSSASSAYAVYWDCGGDIYYIDLYRGIKNPNMYSLTTKYESNEETATGSSTVNSDNYLAQTFTPDSNHTIKYVKLNLKRASDSGSGTVTVAVKAVDGDGHPTGDNLCSGTKDALEIDSDSEAWYTFNLGLGTALTAATQYAIVLLTSTTGNVYWYKSGSEYAGGNAEIITDTSEGPNSPSTVADDDSTGDTAWSDPTNATASDDSYASVTLDVGSLPGGGTSRDASHYLKATDFGFAVTTDLIRGIKAEVECYKTATVFDDIYLLKGSSAFSGSIIIPTSEAYTTSGGGADKWGTDWDASDINDTDFGITLRVAAAFATSTVYVDHIRVTVYYGAWDADTDSDFLFEEWGETETSYYAASSTYISPVFDAGATPIVKLLKRFTTYANKVSTTETVTIYYRTNRTYLDMDTGWTILTTLDAATDNAMVEQEFGSGIGLLVNAVQFKIVLARGTTTTSTPDLQTFVTSFKTDIPAREAWMWTFRVKVDGENGTSAKTKEANLKALAESSYDFSFQFDDETHYVGIDTFYADEQTGTDPKEDTYTISVVEA